MDYRETAPKAANATMYSNTTLTSRHGEKNRQDY